MAQGSTLYRLNIELSNVDDSVYETLTLRVAQHPSEDGPRLMARILAYCLAYEQDLEFGRGLSEALDPALLVKDPSGGFLHWLDIGHPSAERMHRSSKAATRVTVVCHKSAEGLIRERDKKRIHNANKVAVWLLDTEMVRSLSEALDRKSTLTVVRTGSDLMVCVDEQSFSGSLIQTTLASL